MRIKSFFSHSVEAALIQARRELGDDALLLNSRLSAPESRELGVYEVVVGVSEVQESTPADATDLADHLIRQDIEPELAQAIAARFPTGTATEENVRRSIASLLRADSPAIDPNSVQAFIGPSGHGKTLTLIKVAIHTLLHLGVTPVVIGGTARRVGASARLEAVAEIAGIQYESADRPDIIPQLIHSYQGKAPILIDTPGLSTFDQKNFDEWANVLADTDTIQTHLVLSATNRSADLHSAVNRYQAFSFSHLIFTHLDETRFAGGVISVAASTGKPLSWFGYGQSECGDLQKASSSYLLDRIFHLPEQAPQKAFAAGGTQ